MNFEHNYEMLDTVAANPAGAVRDVLVSQIKFDASWFDNATYYFEVVAYNNTGSTQTIELRSNGSGTIGDTQVATVNISATIESTRYRSSSFTPTPASGEYIYTVRIPNYASANYIKLYAARLVIVQSNPTKTRLQFPLCSVNAFASTNTDAYTTYVVSKASLTNSSLGTFGNLVRYDSTKFVTVDSGTPWTVEVVACMQAGTGGASMRTGSNKVTGADQIAITEATSTIYTASWATNATNFTDGSDFHLSYHSDGTNLCSIQRSAFYVKLTPVTKIQSYLRFAKRIGVPEYSTFGEQRIQLNQSNFSGSAAENYYLEVTGYATDAAHPIDSWHAAAMSGTSGESGTEITGAVVSTTGTTGTTAIRSRSSAFTPPTNGYDIYALYDAVTAREESGALIIVEVQDSAAPDGWMGMTVTKQISG